MNIILTGVSHKGKNRCRENGKVWTVITDAAFQGQPAFMVESVLTKDRRWVLKENDCDFNISFDLEVQSNK